MAVSEASVVMERMTSRMGWIRSVALDMECFTSLTAWSISGVNSFLKEAKESVRDQTMWARWSRNQR